MINYVFVSFADCESHFSRLGFDFKRNFAHTPTHSNTHTFETMFDL